MLQLISVDSRHFTEPRLWKYQLRMGSTAPVTLPQHLAPLVIEKDHGQLLIKSALHSYHKDYSQSYYMRIACLFMLVVN